MVPDSSVVKEGGGEQGPHGASGVFVQFPGGWKGTEPAWAAWMHVSKLASSPYHMGMPYSL